MKICVTAKNIAEGDCAFCPVERAFKDAGLDTMVGPTDVSFFTGPVSPPLYLVTVPLPPVAIAFVADFDDNRDPAPIEFEIAIPAEVLQEAAAA